MEQFSEPAKEGLLESAPQSPVTAIERLKQLIERGAETYQADPETIAKLIRPFLMNPGRDEVHVRTIMGLYHLALFSEGFRLAKIPFKKQIKWLLGKKMKNIVANHAPNVLEHISQLELALKKDLRPGSIGLYMRPIQYLATPTGYGIKGFHKYRISVQSLIDSEIDDQLMDVAIELNMIAQHGELVVDEISPQPGFITVGLKETASLQAGEQQAATRKQNLSGGFTIADVNVSASQEATSSQQHSTQFTIGGEQTIPKAAQYLMARKIGGRVMWKTIAGVGPVDASSTEYIADVLIPTDIWEIELQVEARIQWFRSGLVPATLQRVVILPVP